MYCEISDIENYLLTEIDSSMETQVEQWIIGVSRLMDNLANRKLVAPVIGSGEDFEERFYDGNGKGCMFIDDCQEIQTLEIGDQYGDNLVANVDYVVSPRIAPYAKVFLKGGCFSKGIQNIRITGRFGYFNEIPNDIRSACAIITAGIINATNKGNSAKKSESIGNYSVTYLDDKGFAEYDNAVRMLELYRRIEF